MNMKRVYISDALRSESIKVLLSYVSLSAKWFEVGVPCKFGALLCDDVLNVLRCSMVHLVLESVLKVFQV